MPDALGHALAERGIDDQQDRAAIDQAKQLLLRCAHSPISGRASWPGGERQQQLDNDVAGAPDRESALRAQQQASEQRGQQHAEKVGQRGGAKRGRHVAAGDGGEGDRRLDCRRQHRKQDQPSPKRRRQKLWRHGARGQRQGGKQQEGRGQDNDVQPPVARPGQRRLRGQAGAMQEKQQRDRRGGDVAGDDRAGSMHRQQRRQTHHADDSGDIGVDRQPGKQRLAGHTAIPPASAMQQKLDRSCSIVNRSKQRYCHHVS